MLGLIQNCQRTAATPISAIETSNSIRRDVCLRAWKGVTTSRHDVLTEQTKLEIAQDTNARAAYCKGI